MRKITKDFAGVRALNQVDFCVRRGEVHALVGENGAGKSTLIKILAGALPRSSGQILLRGVATHLSNPLEARELGIAVIYQELVLAPSLNAVENIFLGRESRRLRVFLDRRRMTEETHRILEELGARVDITVPVLRLTVAQRQMVEIAKALLLNAELIVMDEPSAVLTSADLERLFSMIRSLKAKGASILYISHRLEEVFDLADRVTVLRDGKLIGTEPVDQLNRADLIRMMVGRDLEPTQRATSVADKEVLLEVRGLCTEGCLKDISFSLRQGEILGIAGLVGAGRTELARAIFGADRRSSGEILVNGKRTRLLRPLDGVNCGIGLVTEDRKDQGMLPLMNVADNMLVSNYRPVQTGPFISQKKTAATCGGFIRDLDIRTSGWRQFVRNLSGGNQQKVILARWLNTNVNILIFDEPTRGIDVAAKQQIHELMRALARSGKSILMISSELPEILAMSDRILVMHEGRLRGELASVEATEEKILHLATGGGKVEVKGTA
ncbi:MAG: sugar ABC transporter ATP-binding protein [Armatimonadetes bacterium]|nr:sugar ABC transporter ATP-binding protein [Armatimonadota bacterium]